MSDLADVLLCAIVRLPLGFCENLLTGKCIIGNLLNKVGVFLLGNATFSDWVLNFRGFQEVWIHTRKKNKVT